MSEETLENRREMLGSGEMAPLGDFFHGDVRILKELRRRQDALFDDEGPGRTPRLVLDGGAERRRRQAGLAAHRLRRIVVKRPFADLRHEPPHAAVLGAPVGNGPTVRRLAERQQKIQCRRLHLHAAPERPLRQRVIARHEPFEGRAQSRRGAKLLTRQMRQAVAKPFRLALFEPEDRHALPGHAKEEAVDAMRMPFGCATI